MLALIVFFFYQNRVINEYARNKNNKISESRSSRVCLWDIEELPFLKKHFNQAQKSISNFRGTNNIFIDSTLYIADSSYTYKRDYTIDKQSPL